MLKKLLVTLIILISIISALTTIKISTEKNISKQTISKLAKTYNDDTKNIFLKDQIGNLTIKKINLDEPLFKINSKENTVEKHVTILKESIFPDKEDSIIFIAAHSGTGKIAYFEELDNLKKDDEVILTLNNKTYKYTVKNYWEEKKNGYINVNKENTNQLILTTCSPTRSNYQLIINCIEKEQVN